MHIRGCNCCQTGIELSKCVYLASMGVKINHTVGGKNQECFQNAYLMVMPVETWGTTKEKIAKNYVFVHRNVMVYTENEIKLNLVANSVILERLSAIIIDVLTTF